MTFGTSLELFALVWALLCIVASAVVIDSLLTGSPRRPEAAAGGAAQRRRSSMARTASAPPGRKDLRDRLTRTTPSVDGGVDPSRGPATTAARSVPLDHR